jgi:hypothetical protein
MNPQNVFQTLFITTILFFNALVALDLPDATSKVLVFSDQLNDAAGSANLAFNATHFIGTQKIDRERILAYKALNPKFIVLQYHKSYGVDLQQNITSPVSPAWNNDCDTFAAWVNRNPTYGNRESYYLHYTNSTDSAHRIKHYWNNVNEYYLADLRHAGWRQYVAETNVWRCMNIGFDGTFFDATYFPSYGYDPETWFDSIPYNAGGITNFGAPWNQTFAVPYWACIHDYFHASGRDYLCIVNCDQMVTGWYNDAYLDSVDGAMAEGFFTYGGKLTGSDWSLSAGRIQRYLTGAEKNKILIAQCSPASTDLSVRRWCIANYLLLKNKYSYYNISYSANANWWPEYEIALDSFAMQPSTLNDLLVSGTASLYKRDYKAGLVLVNPGSASQSYSLAQEYKPLTFSGGGDVTNGVPPAMSVTSGSTVSGTVSVAAGEVLILQKAVASIINSRVGKAGNNRTTHQGALYSLTGKLLKKAGNQSGNALHGAYLLKSDNGRRGYRLKCVVRE